MAAPAGPTVERIVAEAYCKAAEVILASRIYGPRTNTSEGRGRAWFNLEVEEVEGASKALERWRREAGLPLVLEVVLQPWGAQAGTTGQGKVETLLERWVVHYYPMLPEGASHLSRSQLSRLNPSGVYKRLVITLRSLYTYVRVLPAYRMYRACKRQRGSNFTLGYRLHSTLPSSAAAATTPGARRMQTFRFGAVDTPYGQLRISVDYQPASTVTILEQTTSPPPLPQIIADYVGSPMAAQGRTPLRHAMSASAMQASPPPAGGAAAPAAAAVATRQPLSPAPSAPPLQPGSSPQGSSAGSMAAAAAARPGTGAAGAAGMPIIRRSWSSSGRGVSPHRPLSQPPSELPSPVMGRDTPYGSAPQAVSLPAMLRALSTPAANRYTVGSPSGRPPLGKPPRATSVPVAAAAAAMAAAGQAAASPGAPLPQLGGSSSSSSNGAGVGHRSAAIGIGCGRLPSAEEGEEEEDDGESEHGSPGGSAGSGARLISAPVSIPGRRGLAGAGAAGGGGSGAGRRLHSSGDLWALQQAAAMHKPLSAPAVSHMPLQRASAASGVGSSGGGNGAAAAAGGLAEGGRGRGPGGRSTAGPGGEGDGEGEVEAEVEPSPPPARLPLIPGTLDSESSGSAASSLYPTSCSPQLPFAFTPSAQSLASFGARGPLQESARLERISPRLGLGLGRAPSAASSVSGSAGASGGTGAGAALLHMQQAAAQRALSGGGVGTPAGFSPGSGASSGGGGGGGGGGVLLGAGGVSGREVPTHAALMRRPSWSSRSTYGQLAGEASQAGVGYSVSPMQDPGLESLLSGSTPRQFTLAGCGLSPAPSSTLGVGQLAPAGSMPSRTASTASAYGTAHPTLTFPSASGDMGSGSGGGLEEADVLPFALDEGSSSPLRLHTHTTHPGPTPAQHLQQQQVPAASGSDPLQLPVSTAAGTSQPQATAGAGAPAAAAAGADAGKRAAAGAAGAAAAGGLALAAKAPGTPEIDSDAAVGAFVRLIQAAPPLRVRSGGGAVHAGRAASADMAAPVPGGTSSPAPAPGSLQAHPSLPLCSAGASPAPAPGTSSGSDSDASAATCLSDGRGLTLQAGLRQFSRIKERLQQRGVVA